MMSTMLAIRHNIPSTLGPALSGLNKNTGTPAKLGTVVGGAVGGVIAGLLIIITFVLLLLIISLSRSRRSPKETTGDGGLAISNIVYESRESKLVCMCVQWTNC